MLMQYKIDFLFQASSEWMWSMAWNSPVFLININVICFRFHTWIALEFY